MASVSSVSEMKAGVLVVVLLALFSGGRRNPHATYAESWHWTWSCEAGRCVKSSSPLVSSSPPLHGSLSVCRLTCGKYGSMWPRPTGATVLGSHVIPIHPDRINFEVSGGARPFLAAATGIFLSNLEAECGGNCSYVPDSDVTVRISTATSDVTLDWETDEAYILEVVSRNGHVQVEIRAATVYGARHGLETLSQLTAAHQAGHHHHQTTTLVLVSAAQVSDGPTYPHRGLLVDTSRNFIPLAGLKRQVDGLAASKMNVLHWHATDSHSFPLELPRVAQLSRFGAYSASQVYSPTDITDLLAYAKVRGVRVVLEIDAPSHAGNGWQWGEGVGLGNLAVCINRQPWRKFCIQPPCGQLNPANPNMYTVLRDLYKDILDLWPRGEIFHMGGDEVFLPCWNATEEVVEWMDRNGKGRTTEDFLDVWSEFHQTALRIWDEEVGHSDTPVILWSSHLTEADVIEEYLDKDRYVIETWVEKADRLPLDLLAKGYRLIMSTKDTWYLDHGFWGSTRYHNWRAAYDNRLPRHRGVLGGETAMWSELVDEESLDNKVWPRTAAAAERLWADPGSGSLAAQTRFLAHRERLISRGIRPEAVTPGWCFQNDGEC